MRRSTLIIGGIAAALIYSGSRALAMQKSVELFQYTIDPKSIEIRLEGLTPVVKFRLNIFNPNKTSVPVKDVAGSVSFRGATVASFINAAPIAIKAREAASIDLKAKLSGIGLMSAIMAKGADQKIGITGIIKTGAFDLPFTYTANPFSK